MADEQSAGRGHPRLVIVPEGGHATSDSPAALGYEAEFPLNAGRTTIGSGTGQDIVLDGLAAEHAVIDWIADGDEYVFEPLTSASGSGRDKAVSTPETPGAAQVATRPRPHRRRPTPGRACPRRPPARRSAARSH